eukprot:XP_025012692.1 wall-associated receptor kinase-like 2 [Ricinus communis]
MQKILKMIWQIFMLCDIILLAIIERSIAEVPNCTNSSGNVSVPYPFGIGDAKCAFSPHFLLKCNYTGSSAYLLMGEGNIRVLSLSLDEGTMIISAVAGYDCYRSGKPVSTFTYSISLGLYSPFTFSSTRNKLVGLGCDTLALISGLYVDHVIRRRCTSLCDEEGYR